MAFNRKTERKQLMKRIHAAIAAVVPTAMPGSNNAFRAKVFVYFPPKAGKFAGYSEILTLDWDGAEFTAVFE